jgi:hypothetical protein
MNKERNAYRVLVGNLKVGDRLEDMGLDGSVVLKLNLKK